MVKLFVERGTDTMRDTFMAYGLARLLYLLSDTDVQITDMGGAFSLACKTSYEALQTAAADGLPHLLPSIVKPLSATEKKRLEAGEPEADILRRYKPLGWTDIAINYGEAREAERQRATDRKEKREEGGEVGRDVHEFPLWAHLASYFGKGSAMRVGYPLLIHTWHAHNQADDGASALLDVIFMTYSEFPNSLDAAELHWGQHVKPSLQYEDFALFNWEKNQSRLSALSVVSPTTAQGTYTASGAKTLNNSTPEIFWLPMYLALAGFMTAGLPYRGGDGDVVLYYPLPHRVWLEAVQDVMQKYRSSGAARRLYDYSGALPRAKIDALAQINFYAAAVGRLEDDLLIEGEGEPTAVLAGLVGYYYKDISTQIPFDETTFALPAWLAHKVQIDDLAAARGILDEHQKLISSVRTNYAEELQILHHYRRFIALGDSDDWLAFAIAYSQHRFKKMTDARQYFHQLTLHVLKETLMSSNKHDYTVILANEGFKNIARAINHATVLGRYFKDVQKQPSYPFKVRHGLGDDLLRQSHNADAFIEALGAFVHDYLRESSNVQANIGQTRPYISVDDLNQVVALLKDNSSRVVAHLLVAAGYASQHGSRNDASTTNE